MAKGNGRHRGQRKGAAAVPGAVTRYGARQLIRADALKRFARIYDGEPVMCTPPQQSTAERAARGLPPLEPKVIFDSLADAEAFAAAVKDLGEGPSRAYLCPFSHRGHAHLSANLRQGGPSPR